MKKVFFICITLLVISAVSASAQAVFGLRAGLSVPRFSSRDPDYTVNNFGWEAGAVVYYSLKNDFFLNSGLTLNMIELKAFEKSDPEEVESYKVSYLEIPMYLGRSVSWGKVKTYGQVGLYFGFKLSEKYSLTSLQYSLDLDLINSFNTGLGFLYGVDIFRFKVEVGTKFGFIDFFNEKVENDVNLNSIFFGISYVF